MKLNKKIILVSLLIFIGVISVICIFLLNKHDTDEEISNKTYIAYININPLIKFTFMHEVKGNEWTSDF